MMTKVSKMKRITRTIWLVGLLLLLAAPSGAFRGQESPVALAADGTLLRLQDGTYGDLFPDGAATRAEHPVLALEIQYPGGRTERFVVPGTESGDEEDSAVLVFDDPSGAVYLLWQSHFNGLHPLLRVTRFADGAFSEVLDITSGPFAAKGDPQLLITRESAPIASEADEAFPLRTVVHVVWWQEGPGISRKLYAPVVISGDSFVPPTIFDLSLFLEIPEDLEPAAIDPAYENLLGLTLGADHRSMIAGFVDPDQHRLVTLRIDALPLPLTALGDKIPAEIVIIGRHLTSLPDLADEVSARVYELGVAFHESSRSYIAQRVRGLIQESPEEELSEEMLARLGERIRQEILEIGSAIDASGLASLDIGQLFPLGASEGQFVHVLRVTPTASRALPEFGTEEVSGRLRLFLAESGQHALISWERDGAVYFQESLELGWGEVSHVVLGPEIGRDAVYRMLEERVGSR